MTKYFRGIIGPCLDIGDSVRVEVDPCGTMATIHWRSLDPQRVHFQGAFAARCGDTPDHARELAQDLINQTRQAGRG